MYFTNSFSSTLVLPYIRIQYNHWRQWLCGQNKRNISRYIYIVCLLYGLTKWLTGGRLTGTLSGAWRILTRVGRRRCSRGPAQLSLPASSLKMSCTMFTTTGSKKNINQYYVCRIYKNFVLYLVASNVHCDLTLTLCEIKIAEKTRITWGKLEKDGNSEGSNFALYRGSESLINL